MIHFGTGNERECNITYLKLLIDKQNCIQFITLVSFGIPRKIEQLVKVTLEGAQVKVIVDGKISNPFVISRGVRQGDVLCATLFNVVLHKALKNLEQSNTVVNRLTQICDYGDHILVIARSDSSS